MIRQPIPKHYTLGTHRLCDPADTLQTISRHFAAMGITRIADVTGLDSIGIPVAVAIRPNAKSLSVSQGKGLTLLLAKVSAAMESIELFHAENSTLEVTRSSYQVLASTHKVCDPRKLNLHPRTCYHDALPIPWVSGFDLLSESEVLVPYDLVHCSFLPEAARKPVFFISSNGLASGNHLLEAISHGICEVVERDATRLWELKARHAPARTLLLALESVDSAPCQSLFERLRAAGLSVYVWQLTSDVPIPAFGCAIFEEQTTLSLVPIGGFQGFGCHLSKEIAVIRAVTEAIQSRLTYISGARDDLFRESYEVIQSELNQNKWKQSLIHRAASIDYRTIPSLETDSLDQDIATELDLVQNAGFDQVVVVNLTQPPFDIPVVRVIIPGMSLSTESSTKELTEREKRYFMWETMTYQLLTGKV